MASLDENTLCRFAALVAPVAPHIILSGDDWRAVRALGARVPGLRLGFDPSELPEAGGLKTADDFARFARFTIAAAPEATFIYLEYRLVLAAIGAGYDLVGDLHGASRLVDAWTLDLTSPQDLEALSVLIGSGVDQISSNDCVAIERAARGLAAARAPSQTTA